MHSSTEKVVLENSSDSILRGKASKGMISSPFAQGKKMISVSSSFELLSNPK